MNLSQFVNTPRRARDAARFVEMFLLDKSARELFDAPEFAEVVRLAKGGDWRNASIAFRDHTGCDVEISVVAAEIAAKL